MRLLEERGKGEGELGDKRNAKHVLKKKKKVLNYMRRVVASPA